MAKTQSVSPRQFFNSLDLQEMDSDVAEYIRTELIPDERLDLLDKDNEEFLLVKDYIISSYPKSQEVTKEAPKETPKEVAPEPAKKRRADAVDSRPKNWSRNKKYLSAARALQALANVTTDPETKRVAKEDADYFFAKLSKKEYGGEMYHHGGNINYKKDWEVIGITMQGKKFKKIITLGRMSDEFDVKQAIKRMSGSEGIGNIREITSIRELKATGGMIEGWKGFINWLKEDF